MSSRWTLIFDGFFTLFEFTWLFNLNLHFAQITRHSLQLCKSIQPHTWRNHFPQIWKGKVKVMESSNPEIWILWRKIMFSCPRRGFPQSHCFLPLQVVWRFHHKYFHVRLFPSHFPGQKQIKKALQHYPMEILLSLAKDLLRLLYNCSYWKARLKYGWK